MINKRLFLIFSINIIYLLLRHLTVSNNLFITTPYSYPLLPPFLRLVPELVSYFFFVYCLIFRRRRILGYWWFFLFLLFSSLLVSGIMTFTNPNSPDMVRVLSSIRSWFSWISPFFIGMSMFRREDLAQFYKSLVLIGIVQIPFILIQSSSVVNADYVTGLMGEWGSGSLAIFNALGSLYILEYLFARKISPIQAFVIEGLLIIPVILGQALIIFFILPFSWILYFIISRPRPQKRKYFLLILIFLIVIIALIMAIYSFERADYWVSNPLGFLYEKIEKTLAYSPTAYGGGPTRIYYLGYVLRNIAQTPALLFFGHGLGYASSSRLSLANANEEILSSSTGVSSIISTRLLENGLFGVFIFVIFSGGLLFSLFRAKKKFGIAQSDHEAIGITSILLLSVLLIYNASFTAPTFAWILIPQLGILASTKKIGEKYVSSH